METTTDAASPIDIPVRPRAWAIFVDNGNARIWSTLQPHVQKLADAEGLGVTPLYDQAALDASVAAERERCAALCERLWPSDKRSGHEWSDGFADGTCDCADAIRTQPNAMYRDKTCSITSET